MKTKDLVTIALIFTGIFFVVVFVASRLISTSVTNNNLSGTIASSDVTRSSSLKTTSQTVNLTMTEVAKHNSASDCWTVISGQVYNLTSFAGIHSGGSGPILATCGTDSTAAFNARHSAREAASLPPYLIGSLGQTLTSVSTNVVAPTPVQSVPSGRRDNRGDD